MSALAALEIQRMRAEIAALRMQRDFLLESNNRLIEERRAAEENFAKANTMLSDTFERWQEALNKLQECQEKRA